MEEGETNGQIVNTENESGATTNTLQLGDDFLADLSSDIETEDLAEALGRKLGFKQAEINRFMETNHMGRHVTCTGTRQMLFAWRQKVSPSEQPSVLKEALLDAKLVTLAKTYFGENKRTKAAPTSPLEDILQTTLKDHYKTVLCQIQRRPWDPNDFADLKHLFTDISLFKYDRGTGQVQKTPLEGSVNGIFGTEIDGQLPRRMLLTAPGGHGKTCTVAKLAYDWVHQTSGSPMKGLKALFVLKLREVEEEMGFGEAIISQLVGDVPGITSEIVEEFIETNQESCALIVDGYDEYKGSIKSKELLNSLTKVLRNKKLRNLRVLVTTRPYLEGDFMQGELSRVYTKMAIEGFTRESCTNFIKRYFKARSSERSSEELINFLQKNSFLQRLIQVPLFCTMVCHLYEVEALSDASTVTTLFENINRFLYQHALAKEVPSLLSNESTLEDVLQDLGKFAYDGLRGDCMKLVFQEEDFKNYPNAYRVGIKLGILSTTKRPVKHLTSNQTSKTTVEFFHKMEQEYCASVYMRRLALHKDGLFLKVGKTTKLDWLLAREVNTVAKTLEFENVLSFVAGASKPACRAIFRHIASQVKNFVIFYKCRLVLRCIVEAHESFLDDCVISDLRKCFWDGRLDLYPLDDMFMAGMERLPKAGKSQITSVYLFSSHPSVTMTTRLWSCLASFDNLHNLYLNNASLSTDGDQPLPCLTSVNRLEVWSLQEKTFKHLIRCLPSLKDLEVWIGNEDYLDDALKRITWCVDEIGDTLCWITINGLLNVNGSTVSLTTCREFGSVIAEKATRLETLSMVEVKMGQAEGVVETLQSCIAVPTLKELRIMCDANLQINTILTSLDGIGTRRQSSEGFRMRRCKCMKVIIEHPDYSLLNWKVKR